jgi:hypothetical protein
LVITDPIGPTPLGQRCRWISTNQANGPTAVDAADRERHREIPAVRQVQNGPPCFPALAAPRIIDHVAQAVVIIEGLGLSLAIFGCACGTTVIAQQPGHEWCMDVQSPAGSVSDPDNLDQDIAEPDTSTDPSGCLCFSAAEDQVLQEGTLAEQSGQPLPAGYEELRDKLIEAARARCTQIALEREPPLMYTNCLSADVSLPHPGDGAGCTICIEAGVWNGSEMEVECPPGLEDATAGGPGTSTSEATTTGYASVDETGASDSSGFGLRW